MHVPSNTDMYYLMYYAYLQKPRIFKKEMCRYTGTALNTVYKHIKLAKKYDILFSPQLRLLATLKTNEFMYFVKVSDPIECLPILKEMGAFYVCLLSGYYNLMFMSYEPIDITHISQYKTTFLSGKRSNYVVPQIPKQSFEKAYEKIGLKVNNEPEKSVLSLDFPEGITWSDDVWFLYHVLKYDFRLKFTPIIKKYHISVSSFYSRLNEIKKQTDIFIPFYPLGQMQYTIFHLLIKSRYHDLLIDCFSEFPSSSLHCRVKDYLFSRVAISKWTERTSFLKLLSSLQHIGIIEDYETSLPFESQVFHPGSPLPAPSP